MQADEGEVVAGVDDVALSLVSSPRIIIALKPATKKKNSTATRYWIPTTLWSVQRRKYRHGPMLLALAQRRGQPDHPLERVVEEAEAEQEADCPHAHSEEDGDVVLVGPRLRRDVGADLGADPVADDVADDPADDRPR